jgi:hypothetical protein
MNYVSRQDAKAQGLRFSVILRNKLHNYTFITDFFILMLLTTESFFMVHYSEVEPLGLHSQSGDWEREN